jgi:DNA polymerase I-like protein with 3'-5' exonuclease and polymerase domains
MESGVINEILAHRDAHPDLPLVVDSETDGLNPFGGSVIRDIQIGIGADIWHLPLTRPHSDNVARADVVDLLEKLAADRPLLVFANAKFDMSMILADLGVDLSQCPTWDVLTGAWLEDENHPARSLKDRANFLFPDIAATAERDDMRRLLDGPTLKTLEDALYAASRLFGARKVTRAQCNALARQRPEYGRREMWDLTADEIHPYACRDVDLTSRMYHYQNSLDHKHPIATAMPREMQVARVLMGMEKTGILVDTQRAERSHAAAVARLEELENLFEDVNLGSHGQLAKLVYEDWGFPVFKRSPKTESPSTDRETLELLGDDDRIVALLEWRRLQKAVTAYYRPLLTQVGPDGRIHPSFKPRGTRTGRASCERPNLQTIPREDTDSEVRALFRPTPGYALVGFDLAQAEVRWAAALSRDPTLIAACQTSDVYTTVATQMGVDRARAKQTVLASNYGAGAEQLASTLLKGSGRMVTPADVRGASDLQQRLRRAFPVMAKAADQLEHIAHRDGRFPLHPPGRYRHFRGPGHAPEEYRKAWNSACQGGIAELLYDLMIVLDEQGIWAAHGARPILTIHDELLAEVPPQNIRSLARVIQIVLDDVNPLSAVRQIIEIKMWRRAQVPFAQCGRFVNV